MPFLLLGHAGGGLGLAFQLTDDLIGTFGTAGQAGRDGGGDLREAKRTPLVALAQDSGAAVRVDEALAHAHTGSVAVQRARTALEESGARTRLREIITETLDDVRRSSDDTALTPAAAVLLRTLADGIEARIP